MQVEHNTLSSQDVKKLPGHWLLAQLGKRVLRPGGIELTKQMIESLQIQTTDEIVEFAPGLGATTKLALNLNPSTYTGIERDEQAAQIVRNVLTGSTQQCKVGNAEDTGLPSSQATVVFGEAMLSMQSAQAKSRIVNEAYRLLKPGGRYAIHELSLIPDDLEDSTKQAISKDLSQIIHHGVRPLTFPEWSKSLTATGFVIKQHATAPMHLLEPRRIVSDEGLLGAMRFAFKIATHGEARKRVLAMRGVFRKYKKHLAAILIVAQKPRQ